MLNKTEHKVMGYIFERCKGKKTELMTPQQILEEVGKHGERYELTAKQLEIKIKNIMLDGYIEVFHSDNKGVLNYVIKLTTKGEAYQREIDEIRKKRIHSIGWKVLLSAIGVGVVLILSWIIGR